MGRSLRVLGASVAVVLVTALLVPLGGVAQANHGARCLDLSPETESNPVNSTHVVTATLRIAAAASCTSAQTADDPPNGAVTISFEITGVNDADGNTLAQPDRSCTIQPNQTSCTVSYVGVSLGTDTIRGWVVETGAVADADEQEGTAEGTTPGRLAEADSTDVVSKTWVNPSTANLLDCAPETATNPTGTSHTIGCTVRDSTGAVLANTNVDVEATGANDPDSGNTLTTPDFTCTTTGSGTCQFTHGTGTGTSGTTTYRAWVDANNTNGTSEADQTEGQDSGATPGSVPEEDNTDVVTKSWTPGAATALDCDDQTGPDTERESNPGTGSGDPTSAETYTCRVIDASGNNASGTFTVFGEVETTVNDPDNPDANSHTSPDYQCSTVNGTCQITVTQSENEVGTTNICFWVGANGATLCGAEAIAEGAAANGSDGGNDFADKVEKTWVVATTASRLDCTPETDSNPTGTAHTITCTARDASNALVNGAQIDLEVAGVNDTDNANTPTTPDLTCTTAGAGTCNLVDSTGNTTPGFTTYRAWIDRDGSNATVEADQAEASDEVATPGTKAEPDDTDVVNKTWVGGPASLTITPTSDVGAVGSCNPFTIQVRDSANQGISNLVVDVEQVHQLATDNVANNEPQVSFCTPATGVNPSAITANTGDRVESPDNLGTAGGETTARTDATGRITIGVAVAPANGVTGAGNVVVTAFHETTDDDDPAAPQVAATKTWEVPAARTIACSPVQGTNPTGANYNVTCTVRDQFGQVLSGQGVVFTTAGPGTLTTATTLTTNQFGQATVTATSLDPGVQTITGTLQADLTGAEPAEVDECDRPANSPAGAPAGVCSNSVTHTWTQAAVASVVLSPNEWTTRVGGQSTFTFQARDANGTPVAGVPVAWTMVGIGSIVSSDVETNANGTAVAVLTTDRPGNATLQASVPGCGSTCTDFSRQHWGPIDCTIFGTNGHDTLRGTLGADTICGFKGNDRIIGRAGNDIVLAGGGKDTLRGGDGSDSLKGGGGDDKISGGSGSDLLYGGSGDDELNGNEGTDGCRPGPGRDTERSCEGTIVGRRQI